MRRPVHLMRAWICLCAFTIAASECPVSLDGLLGDDEAASWLQVSANKSHVSDQEVAAVEAKGAPNSTVDVVLLVQAAQKAALESEQGGPSRKMTPGDFTTAWLFAAMVVTPMLCFLWCPAASSRDAGSRISGTPVQAPPPQVPSQRLGNNFQMPVVKSDLVAKIFLDAATALRNAERKAQDDVVKGYNEQLESKDSPGTYVLLNDAAVTAGSNLASEVVARVVKGQQVVVINIIRNSIDLRIRAQIKSPAGWISLVDLADGFRWAEKLPVDRPRLPA